MAKKKKDDILEESQDDEVIFDDAELDVRDMDDSELMESIETPTMDHLSDKVKISFGQFIRLVASHSFLDVVEKNKDAEVIVSSDLLSDLANAHHQPEARKLPIVFLVGIILGLVIAYFILTT